MISDRSWYGTIRLGDVAQYELDAIDCTAFGLPNALSIARQLWHQELRQCRLESLLPKSTMLRSVLNVGSDFSSLISSVKRYLITLKTVPSTTICPNTTGFRYGSIFRTDFLRPSPSTHHLSLLTLPSSPTSEDLSPSPHLNSPSTTAPTAVYQPTSL